MRLIVIALILSLCSGCIVRQREVIRLPGTPVLIGEIDGNYAEVFSYNTEAHAMIRIGWINLNDYQGWTISNFDWASYIKGLE